MMLGLTFLPPFPLMLLSKKLYPFSQAAMASTLKQHLVGIVVRCVAFLGVMLFWIFIMLAAYTSVMILSIGVKGGGYLPLLPS